MAGIVFCLLFVEQAFSANYQNPIIPGFNPDPSIVRVGDDYYLATSSFEYFPGVPIYHSKDLVNWQHLSYALTRKSQLPLDNPSVRGHAFSDGIYAPTIRYWNGTFYMITTNRSNGGNFYVTAENPAGPWSDPIWVKTKDGQKDMTDEFDPDLFFDCEQDDEECTVYYTRQNGGHGGHITGAEIDIETGVLKGDLTEVWANMGTVWPEGNHIYNIDGKYYNIRAENGTAWSHQIAIARSDDPLKFTETHLILGAGQAYSNNGHADLVQTQNGEWWMVFLGVRTEVTGGQFLGRETFMLPVEWSDGWPNVPEGLNYKGSLPGPNLPEHKFPKPSKRDEFEGDELAIQWNFVRNLDSAQWSLDDKSGWLRITGNQYNMGNDPESPALIVRRQHQFTATHSTRVDFEPKSENGQAGIAIRKDENGNGRFMVQKGSGKSGREVCVYWQGNVQGTCQPVDADGPVTLEVIGNGSAYNFVAYDAEGNELSMDAEIGYGGLSDGAFNGYFMGIMVGMYVEGNGETAYFDWYEYEEAEPPVPFEDWEEKVHDLPSKVQAEYFSVDNDAYNDIPGGETNSDYRADTEVDINQGGEGYAVNWIYSGEWLKYDVRVNAAGTYTAKANAATAQQFDSKIVIKVDGEERAEVDVTSTGGWNAFKKFEFEIELKESDKEVVIEFEGDTDDPLMNLDYVDFHLPGFEYSSSSEEPSSSSEGESSRDEESSSSEDTNGQSDSSSSENRSSSDKESSSRDEESSSSEDISPVLDDEFKLRASIAEGILNIQSQIANVRVEIYDLSGQRHLVEQNQMSIALSNKLKRGLYLVRIGNGFDSKVVSYFNP